MTRSAVAPSRSSAGEVVGGVVILVAALALCGFALVVATGYEPGFFGVMAAFVIGISGLGILIASREARVRRGPS